jgi:hypothetical protein
MKVLSAAAAAFLAFSAGGARAQQPEPESVAEPSGQPIAEPSWPAPTQMPPPPPESVAPPSEPQVQNVQTHSVRRHVNGQWVYTEQYGWVWIPYEAQYTYAPTGPHTDPYEYVYCPSYGWSWLPAPWVFGEGAFPYFGARGPGRYGWSHHPAFMRPPGFVPMTAGQRPRYGLFRPGLVRQGLVAPPGFVAHPGFGFARPNPVRIVPDPGFAGRSPAPVPPGPGYAPSGRITR